MYFRLVRNSLSAFGLALVLAGCGGPERIEITETRALQPSEQKPKLDAKVEDRFAVAKMFAGVPTQDTRPVEPSQGRSGAQAQLAWDTPEGWTDAGRTEMREANLKIGENGEGECYVMRAGGSLEANVNRWRDQMGMAPATAEELSALPTRELFGIPAYVVDLKGDFKGMGETEAMKDYRMLGLILPVGNTGQSLFVKMVGPQQLLGDNESNFYAFCDSLRVEQPN